MAICSSATSVDGNTTASNIANANSVSSSAGETYRARQPIFEAALQQASGYQNQSVPVQVAGIVESDKPLVRQFSPNHPLADPEGYIYKPNVNIVEEMANMMSASKSYQANIQVVEATKTILSRTLQLGQGR